VTGLDLLNTLVDKSIVVCVGDATGQVRYDMLYTLEQYGRERLVESAEMEAVGSSPAVLPRLCRKASPKLLDRSLAAIERVEREFSNLRLAMAWASSSDVNRCLRVPWWGNRRLTFELA
jgi:predicted ATPase